MPQSRISGQATHVPDTPNGNRREDKLDSIKAEVEKLNRQYNNLFFVIRKIQIQCMNPEELEIKLQKIE